MLKDFFTPVTILNVCICVYYHVFLKALFNRKSKGALVAMEVWQLTLSPEGVLNLFIVWEVLDKLLLLLVGEGLWPSQQKIAVDFQSV